MTVKTLRNLLKGLPSEMEVVMPLGEDSFITVCAENSMVIELQVAENENDDSGDISEVLLLVGCTCDVDTELLPNISEDQMN